MQPLKILLIGNRRNEHSLFEKINTSDFSSKIFTAGEKSFSKNFISYSTIDELAQNAIKEGIELVITDCEKASSSGVIEILSSFGLNCIGTNRKYSRLGTSKLFAKKFMDKYNINHPKSLADEEIHYYPIIMKHDFGDKKSKVIFSKDELFNEKQNFHEDYFLEEFLDGDELSVTSYFNGEELINFEPVRIHKQELETVGSFCPVYLSYEKYDKLQNYLTRFEHALLEDDANFKGFITSNLIWTNDEWYILSFSTEIGNSTLLNHFDSDFLATILYSTKQRYKEKTTATLLVKNKNVEKNKTKEIYIPKNENIKIFHQGLKKENNYLYPTNENVLSITTTSDFPFKELENFAKQIEMTDIEYQTNLQN